MEVDRVPTIERLEAFIGRWTMEATIPDAQPGYTVFDWMPGGGFLVQRWGFPYDIEHADFGGISIIGPDPERQAYVQHYFDSRGVARIYRMSYADGIWRLWRDSADFSPLDFRQRFTGTFAADGRTIEGRWEISHDGSSWERDFNLTYTKVDG